MVKSINRLPKGQRFLFDLNELVVQSLRYIALLLEFGSSLLKLLDLFVFLCFEECASESQLFDLFTAGFEILIHLFGIGLHLQPEALKVFVGCLDLAPQLFNQQCVLLRIASG